MEQLVNFIIRPPRAEYDPKNDLLEEEFMLRGKWYKRNDVEINNSRGDVLQCSHYVPIVTPEEKPLPCVIYCHGNSGCRADASEAAIILLPSNITVFTLDFSGSGLSGGDHVTLGWNEKDDLKAVVEYLRADGNVSLIGLWGRSMGAVTSLMYGAEDPSIAGMVLDSPFSDLVDLMMELVDTYRVRLPKFTVKFAIQIMRRSIQKKAKFDITDLNTIKVAKTCFVPVLFGHATDDDFIRPHHSDRIYDAYVGDKNIIKFDGDHNSPRPQFYFDSINIFFHNVLQPPEDEVGESFFDPLQDYFGKGAWRTVRPVDRDNELSSPSTEATPGSAQDDIKRLRSRRPMSRIEVPSDISSGNNQSKTKDQKGDDLCSSSSQMISFEFSNGNPYGPHVPTTMDDDQYVEYEFDDLAGFPSDVDEEERMFMEAVMLSLKDLDTRNPQPQAEEQRASAGPDSLKSPQKDDKPEAASSIEHHEHSKTEATSTSSQQSGLSKEDSTSTSVTKTHVSEHNHQTLDSREPSMEPASDVSRSAKGSGNLGPSHNATSSSTQSTSEADLSSKTKATLTVERNPASNIMDGLIRRWDFSFFRNNQSK